MSELILISFGENISNIISVASDLGYDPIIVKQDVNKLDSFSFKPFGKSSCFIAFDKIFLGLSVKYLFEKARLHRVNLVNIISSSSIISKSGRIGSNIYIGRSVNLKADVNLNNCIMINDGSTIGVGTRINSFTSIGRDVQISSHCIVGEHCYIGNRAIISSPSIGDFCCLEKPLLYDEIYPPRTHLLIGHRSPIEDL